MLKLTLALIVAIYGGMIIWGTPLPEVAENVEEQSDDTLAVASAGYDRPVILGQRNGDDTVTRAAPQDIVVPDPATIAAAAPDPSATLTATRTIGDPALVSLVPWDRSDQTEAAETAAPAPETGPLMTVTGSVVNMRAGPSTSNAVVGSLPQGAVAEAIGAPQNGWQQIRDVATGQTGWMFARFLEPA